MRGVGSFTFVVVLGVVLAGCHSPSPHVTDAAVDTTAPVFDTPLFDAFQPDTGTGLTESHKLGMNDITFLLRLPIDTSLAATLGTLAGIGAPTHDLVPRPAFAQLVTDHGGDVTVPFEAFHIVGVRFDLCDRAHTTTPCAITADGQLRVVFQSVVESTTDVALQAFYPIPNADLAAVVMELRALARLRDAPTEAPLAPNDTLDVSAPPSEYSHRFHALVAHYAEPARLARLYLIAQHAMEPPLNYVMRGITRTSSGFASIAIPTLTAAPQQHVEITSPSFIPTFTAAPVADVPVGLVDALAGGGTAFGMLSHADQVAAITALATSVNPRRHSEGSVACIACHTPASQLVREAQSANIDVSTLPETFSSSRALATNSQTTTLRNFGWGTNAGYPVITPRVVNETAVALDEIDSYYPPAVATILADAAPIDAPPNVKRVFVTRTAYTGNLRAAGGATTGLAGADALCAQAAANGHLGGQWVAWVSTTTVDAVDRLTHDGPWYLGDGTTVVFPDKAALATGPLNAIIRDELGAFPPAPLHNIWTGTAANGRVATGRNCSDWTVDGSNSVVGLVGSYGNPASTWTEGADVLCDAKVGRLFCFEL